MALKLTKADLEELRADGATIRSKSKPVAEIPKPKESAPPEIDMAGIHHVVYGAVRDGLEQQPRSPAPSYRFDVKRDANGLIESIKAYPITR